jgi:hypothetical protein
MAESGIGDLLLGTRAYRFTHIHMQDCPGEVTFKMILKGLSGFGNRLEGIFPVTIIKGHLIPGPSKTV